MKYSLECGVDGKVIIGKRIEVTKRSKDFVLIPDKDGLLLSIKISAKVTKPEKFRSRVESGDGRATAKFIIKRDHELHQELIQEFQELESILSFNTNGALKRIGWDEPKDEVIPEDDDEKAQIGIAGFHVQKKYPDLTAKLDEKAFGDIVHTKHHYATLVLPQAFFKEGINEFNSRRYINAFYNFYFVMEDLYGKRKTKNKDITTAFKESTEFREFVSWIMANHIGTSPKHLSNIQRFCNEEKVAYDIDGLTELLQKVRGNLHHYSSRSSKHLGSPFNHEDFESIAFLVMGIAVRAILQKILEINISLGIAK